MSFAVRLVGLFLVLATVNTNGADKLFRAGASAADITPTKLPAIVNGGFREKTSDTVYDRLYARCLVLDDGRERIALVVVDSCMVPRDLCDQAKTLAAKATGIRTDRILISSTHTHSAPSAMGALGSSADPNYIKELPGMIAEGISTAQKRLQPAHVGWGVINAPEHTNCRRWIMRTDKMRTDPFGEKNVRAMMHPGHQNPAYIGPSGPVDTGLSLLAVKTANGEPLAMFANFSMHYYGSGAISADYFGVFATEFAKLIQAKDGNMGFIAAMSQGTSGDLQWMDYGSPRKNRDRDKYAAELAGIAHEAYQEIDFKPWVSLAMAESRIRLKRRVAPPERLKWANKIAATLKQRKPISQQEIYAREQVFIANDPVRELILQAVRIGDLGITAIPNEVYSITGLKLKAFSPLQPTFNIELANGSEGYIPPPEQHRLGGYTTWEARSAALETNAEPKIVDRLLKLLGKVSGKRRREFAESHGPYANAVLADRPIAYWRMGEMKLGVAKDSSGNRNHSRLEHPYARYLEGVPGDGFCQGGAINRSVQFVGGHLKAAVQINHPYRTIEFWFWNGFPPEARETTGQLLAFGPNRLDLIRSRDKTASHLRFANRTGGSRIEKQRWHHVALIRQSGETSIWLDGSKELSIAGPMVMDMQPLVLANGLEGRLDEIAVYDRPLSPEELNERIRFSGIAEFRQTIRLRKIDEARHKRIQLAGPELKPTFVAALRDAEPVLHWSFDTETKAIIEGSVSTADNSNAQERNVLTGFSNLSARFDGGRIKTRLEDLPLNYSVSLWFRNQRPNNAQAVTGYMFSRGPDGDRMCPGDHLGIGGNYRDSRPGHLFVYNGNQAAQIALGETVIKPDTWNHVVMVRDGDYIKAWLNGKLEIDTDLRPSIAASETRIYFGSRSDNFASFSGNIDEVTVFDRALTTAEAIGLYTAGK